jgi:peptidoglycan hydrolase CwlO-like protein
LNELQKDIEHLQNQITIIENNLEEEAWQYKN